MTRAAVALTLACVLVGCGESSGPAGPANMVEAGGNGQTGPAFGAVAVPLRVLATGSNGAAFAGATVTWHVTLSGASVNPATSVTDAGGFASTTVTLGGVGAASVQARTGGLTVTFQLTSVDPCSYLAPFAADTSVAASLTPTDCDDPAPPPFGTTYFDFYRLPIASQRMVAVGMQSTTVDAFLWLWNAAGTGPLVALDDDGGEGTNSLIKALLPSGTYVLGANSFDSTTQFGAYTLASVPQTTVAACEDVWLSGNVVFNETVATTDCGFEVSPGSFYYSDAFLIILFSGQSVTLLQSSAAFDSYLTLYEATDSVRLVAENDNGGGGTNAQITHVAAQSAVFIIDAGTASTGQTGAYTLSISPISGAPPVGPLGFVPRPGERLNVARPRLGFPLRRH